jgi:pyrroloquinoline quinone (PQQ) biosynthesis protein C
LTTAQAQQQALGTLQFKLDILWSMKDAMALHYGIQG